MSTLATFPRTLISWWTFTQAGRAIPYLAANRLDEVERKEKGCSKPFLYALPRLVPSLAEPLVVTFPRVSIDFRRESVDRGIYRNAKSN